MPCQVVSPSLPRGADAGERGAELGETLEMVHRAEVVDVPG
jgi:hypothetical protein